MGVVCLKSITLSKQNEAQASQKSLLWDHKSVPPLSPEGLEHSHGCWTAVLALSELSNPFGAGISSLGILPPCPHHRSQGSSRGCPWLSLPGMAPWGDTVHPHPAVPPFPTALTLQSMESAFPPGHKSVFIPSPAWELETPSMSMKSSS